MNIAYDAILLLGRSGIERYARELIKHVAVLSDEYQLQLVSGVEYGGATQEYFRGYGNIKAHSVIPHERRLGAPLRLVMRALQKRAFTRAIRGSDVVHILGPTKFVPNGVPLVATIHDLFPMDPSMGLSSEMRRRFPARVMRQLRSASAIVCPSTYVAGTIRETFPWYTGPIAVTPLAASDAFVPTELSDSVRKRHGIRDRFVLFVGRVDPRKNIPRMLRAWSLLPADVRSNSQFVLLVAGDQESLKRMQQEHASILSDPSIRLIYELPSDEMIQLMSSARALVFTTLGEGFGLPVIEAMKCGCPVITSSLTSLPEVGGDAALYVDPTEEEAIAEAIERVLTQDELVATMRAKGLEQSKRFTWHETAKKTVDVYRSIM
jgi:glycosyltransferase involved in cell wall biosynthesis